MKKFKLIREYTVYEDAIIEAENIDEVRKIYNSRPEKLNWEFMFGDETRKLTSIQETK